MPRVQMTFPEGVLRRDLDAQTRPVFAQHLADFRPVVTAKLIGNGSAGLSESALEGIAGLRQIIHYLLTRG
jgi:hypothetical protein